MNITKILIILFLFSIHLISEDNLSFKLTIDDTKYIENKSFNIYITQWEPFTIQGEKHVSGLSSELWDDIISRSNIKFQLINVDKFSMALEKIKNDPQGMIIATSSTKEREEYASFSIPYASFPVAITTTIDKDFMLDLKQLEGKIVAVGENYTAYKLLKKYYPNIKFVQTKDTLEALKLVSTNKAYAAADIFPALTHYMNNYSFSNLKISGKSEFDFDLKIMVNKNSKEIIPILDNLIMTIDSTKKQNIINKWMFTKEIIKKDYTLAYIILGISLIIIFIILYNHNLKSKYQKILIEEKQKFKSILDLAYDGIHIINKNGDLLEYSKSFPEMLGYEYEEIKNFNVKDWDIFIPQNELKNAIKKLLEESAVFETKHKKKNGEIIDVQISAKAIRIHDETYLYASSKDITDLKDNEKQIQNYLNLINENIITSSTDLKGTITYVSDAFCKISGYTEKELIGQNHSLVKHPDTPNEIFKDLWNIISNDKIWKGELKNRKKDGSFYWVKSTITPNFDKFGKKIGYTSIRQDITDKKIIEKLSITDALTNLFNRRYFDEKFIQLLNSAKREKKYFCFIMMDIDHFKQYNDTYGHQMGDEVLIKVANQLKISLNRADDYCFRLGGEEFGIIFKAEDINKAISFADKIRKSIEELEIIHEKNSASKYVTTSMGLIIINSDENIEISEAYKLADELLYKAKETGRNKVSY